MLSSMNIYGKLEHFMCTEEIYSSQSWAGRAMVYLHC